MTIVVPVIIVIATVIATEALAAWVHEHVMHGWGWGWHRSHHEVTDGALEVNDLYSVVFGVFSVILFLIGSAYISFLWWVAIGLCVYGVLYYFVHDGLVHQRWPFRYVPKQGYLRRLYEAHLLHHAVHSRDGAVSFGFLFAKTPEELKAELRANSQTRAMASRS
ncbi:MAG: sterol desaturase family protein [Pseudomonadota bacterium]